MKKTVVYIVASNLVQHGIQLDSLKNTHGDFVLGAGILLLVLVYFFPKPRKIIKSRKK